MKKNKIFSFNPLTCSVPDALFRVKTGGARKLLPIIVVGISKLFEKMGGWWWKNHIGAGACIIVPQKKNEAAGIVFFFFFFFPASSRLGDFM